MSIFCTPFAHPPPQQMGLKMDRECCCSVSSVKEKAPPSHSSALSASAPAPVPGGKVHSGPPFKPFQVTGQHCILYMLGICLS